MTAGVKATFSSFTTGRPGAVAKKFFRQKNWMFELACGANNHWL